MRTPDDLAIIGADIRSWKKPDVSELPEAKRANYLARCEALMAVVGGSSFRSAALQNSVDERTVKKDAYKALEIGHDGYVWGFRACTPFANRRARSVPASRPEPPAHKHAYAFSTLLEATPRAKAVVEKYRGTLPTGRRKARAFDRHVREFLAIVRAEHGENVYPFMLDDDGRGALLKYHKRVRRARHDAGAAEADATEPRVTRLNHLFSWLPLERLEFDAHKIDVDWILEIDHPDGHVVQRKITCINYLVVVCAASRYLVAHLLVLGAYNRVDVLRLFHRALVPWKPRALIVEDMRYPDGARLGLPFDSSGACPRGILIAGDNAKAHHANVVVDNLLKSYRGILNLGRAHVPEARPIVEGLNHRLENGALRNIAGGFHPQSRSGEGKKPTSYLRAKEHPLHWVALEDLIDVIGAGYNISPHSGLNNRLPQDVLDAHLHSGWTWSATEAACDASAITTIRFTAHIRGNQSEGRQPYVQYHKARYRSPRLRGQWHLLRRTFKAEANIEDLRTIVLLDPKDGATWSCLRALPPWDRTAHDLHLRQQINRAAHRGLLSLVGASDAIAVFNDFTRQQALSRRGSADLYARVNKTLAESGAASGIPRRPGTVPPRTGRTSFANEKD